MEVGAGESLELEVETLARLDAFGGLVNFLLADCLSLGAMVKIQEGERDTQMTQKEEEGENGRSEKEE